ncbi:uncharacterized protein LOC119662230 [Teleopsis dalmanni]|uniref:uncharacterized protein LOC119662230 n=1 Tax=Teleopsis dalmanni TaxID=139649 RepID=UPI000D32C2A6|nr:uncharacterized protein LOC119662230 [Teleopsis dalmanni]
MDKKETDIDYLKQGAMPKVRMNNPGSKNPAEMEADKSVEIDETINVNAELQMHHVNDGFSEPLVKNGNTASKPQDAIVSDNQPVAKSKPMLEWMKPILKVIAIKIIIAIACYILLTFIDQMQNSYK